VGDQNPGPKESGSVDLRDLSLDELRSRRRKAEKEELDLSYVRRLIHGRIDIIKAELARRSGNGADLIENLKTILADAPSGGKKQQGRHLGFEDAQIVNPVAQRAQIALTNAATLDLPGLSDDQLKDALAELKTHEREVSEARHGLHKRIDSMGSELTRRYREGSAQVDDLLASARRM
jgi:hypothetical protein